MAGVAVEGQQEQRAGLPTPQSTSSYWHQEPSEKLLGHRTTAQLPAEADVVVVGSGITGAFAARELVAGGRRVVMLEAREACWGATGRNGGHCQPLLYTNPPHIARFELATLEFLDGLIAANAIPCGWQVVGGVHGIDTPELLDLISRNVAELHRAAPDLADKAVLVTDAGRIRDLELPPSALGAVFQPRAARCWPYKLVSWLLERLLQDHGGEVFNLQTTTPVTQLRRSTGDFSTSRWILETPRGEIAAHDVLLATNGYTSYLLPHMTGLVVPVRGQVCALRPPDCSRPLAHSHVWIVDESDDYLIQRAGDGEDRALIFGGERLSVEDGGVGVSRDDEVDPVVGRHLRRALAAAVKLRQPDEEEEPELAAAYEWTGVMGYSQDHYPWVGRVPDQLADSSSGSGSGLWVCAGYSGHGMPVAARCAIAVSDMILGREGDPRVELPPEFAVSADRVREARGKRLKRSALAELGLAATD